MGEVYRAEDLRLSQNVALKFLPLSMTQDENARARFHQEVRLAREVSHPNVCRVFDIGEIEGRLFLTMEYVDGEDLASLLRRIGQFPQAKALDIARQMCAGIAAAHEHGVLHRDLKPANIMLDGRGRVRITDFGLASLAENLDAAELRSGTPAYMAPEQLAGTEVTQRSDIYSLGLVLYEIFAGKKAFDAATLPELLRLREKSAPSSISSIVHDVDPLVERVILRCLEKDPAKRPATALQVAAALPGGDPLAAALAAGETPSPEMVAAAGAKEGLRPNIAWMCFLLMLVGLAGVALLADKLTILSYAPLPMSPDVLAAKARETAQQLKCGSESLDSFHGFGRFTGYFDYVKQHDQSKTRWESLRSGVPPILVFWYRQAPVYLESNEFYSSQTIAPDLPPNTSPGMCQMFFDMQGRLAEMEAVPPQYDKSSEPAPATNWSALFAAAGLDLAAFHTVAPQWTSPNDSDTRAAWEGNWPGKPNLPLRVEAASYRGNPVFLKLVWPWMIPDQTHATRSGWSDTVQSALLILALFIVLFFGMRLAAKNLATGRADRQGAFRLALFVFLLTCSAGILFEHHVPTTHELMIFMIATGWGLIAAAIVWFLYLALESHVRRRWPNSLISWSRLVAGQWRDPLVGRDILIGLLTGVVWVVLERSSLWVTITWLNKVPLPPVDALDLIQLQGIRFSIADILLNVVIFVFGALAFFLVFFMLKLRLKKDWFAAWAMVLLFAIPAALSDNPALNFASAALLCGLGIFVLLRFGLLALLLTLVVNNVLEAYPLTARIFEWHGQATLFVFALILVLAIFGLRTATKGQPLFGAIAVED
jgi:serine/threonine-protein kinase